MADLIKKIKIKKQDGTFTDYIPIGAEASNVETLDGESVQLKLNKKPYYYNTVADMKADTKLKVGDTVITLGYYSVNDGGAGEYLISKNEVANEINIPVGNYYAVLIVKNETINIKQIGGYGDGINDDTDALKLLFTSKYNGFLPSGIYNINEYLTINKNDKKYYSDGEAVLFYTPGGRLDIPARPYSLLTISGNNLEFENITLDANNNYIRRPHTTETEEYTEWLDYRSKSIKCLFVTASNNLKMKNCIFNEGMIKLLNSDNFEISNCKVLNVCADSYYFADGCKNGLISHCYGENNGDDCFSSNIETHTEAPYNLTFDSCSAKGIEGAMFCCYGSHDITIVNSYGEDIRRCGGVRTQTASQTGYDTFYPYNITVDNCSFYFANDIGGNDTSSGRGTSSSFITGSPSRKNNSNIKITNSNFIRENGALLYYLYFLNTSDVTFEKCNFKNVNLRSIDLNNYKINFLNCILELNQELSLYGAINSEIINCSITNDCQQARPNTDIQTDTRACILNYASYENKYLNNEYSISNASTTYTKAIKIDSNFTTLGSFKFLFITDTNNIRCYHADATFNIINTGIINFSESQGVGLANFDSSYLISRRPIIVDKQVTPTSTTRTYEYFDLSSYISRAPLAIIPVVKAPSSNADAFLKDLCLENFDSTAVYIRYTPGTADLTYTIRLVIYPY